MAATFLIKRGKRAVYRQSRAHIARFDPRGGVVGAWCPAKGLNLSSNVPWGLKVCKHCVRRCQA